MHTCMWLQLHIPVIPTPEGGCDLEPFFTYGTLMLPQHVASPYCRPHHGIFYVAEGWISDVSQELWRDALQAAAAADALPSQQQQEQPLLQEPRPSSAPLSTPHLSTLQRTSSMQRPSTTGGRTSGQRSSLVSRVDLAAAEQLDSGNEPSGRRRARSSAAVPTSQQQWSHEDGGDVIADRASRDIHDGADLAVPARHSHRSSSAAGQRRSAAGDLAAVSHAQVQLEEGPRSSAIHQQRQSGRQSLVQLQEQQRSTLDMKSEMQAPQRVSRVSQMQQQPRSSVLLRPSRVSTNQAQGASRHSLAAQQQSSDISLTEPLPQRVSMHSQQQARQQQRMSSHPAAPRHSSRQAAAGQHQQLPPEANSTQHRTSMRVSSLGDSQAAGTSRKTSAILQDGARNSKRVSVTGAGDDAGSSDVNPLVPQRVSHLQFMAARLSTAQQVPPSRSSIHTSLPPSTPAAAAAAARYSVANGATAPARRSSMQRSKGTGYSSGSGSGSGYSSDSEGGMSGSELDYSSGTGSSRDDISSGDEASYDSRRRSRGSRQHAKQAPTRSTPWWVMGFCCESSQ